MNPPSGNPAGALDRAEPAPPPGRFVHVLFKGRRVEIFSNPSGLPLSPRQMVVVEVERGTDLGEVLAVHDRDLRRRRDQAPNRILRMAGAEDLAQLERRRGEDHRSLELVKGRVAHFRLPMHMIDAEHQFDGNRVTFYFTAEHRVDFRELVRDLAGIFRMRIELRQIGSREAARRLGGLGCCGRELCCRSFLWEFEPVTLQMAREQKLVLNPSRLSGICGRLLCCLIYEGVADPADGRCPECPLAEEELPPPGRGMIDTHAHLHVTAFDRDRAEACRRAFAAGLRYLMEVNIDAAGWPRTIELARSDPRIFASAGIHPHDTGNAAPEDLTRLEKELEDPRLRALGETGLDYYRNYAPHDVQRRFFLRHVALARETGLPLIVHARQAEGGPSAHEDALKLLAQEGRGRVRGVFHCFSGDLETARRVGGLGFLLGLGGAITYSPGRTGPLLRSIAEALGSAAFVLETDCPYLTPHPRRHDRNEPANIPVIAEALAGYLGRPVKEIEDSTDRAAIELFRMETP